MATENDTVASIGASQCGFGAPASNADVPHVVHAGAAFVAWVSAAHPGKKDDCAPRCAALARVTRTDAFARWLGGTSISIDIKGAGTDVFPGAVIVRRACVGVLFAIRIEESVALEGYFIVDDAFFASDDT